jgi:hypothetical protein
MLFDTSSMLISVAKSDEDSQAEYLTMAKRIADLHKILVLAVVSGIAYIPFASSRFLVSYTIFFSGVAIVPILNRGKCPLTQWEKHLLQEGGEQPYEGSCIPHYLPFVSPRLVHIGKILIALTLIAVWIFK